VGPANHEKQEAVGFAQAAYFSPGSATAFPESHGKSKFSAGLGILALTLPPRPLYILLKIKFVSNGRDND
jgi:hypothetical protein